MSIHSYIRDHVKVIGFFILYSFIFSVIFVLYRLPLGPLFYGLSLTLFFGFIFSFISYRTEKEKYKFLESLRGVSYEIFPKIPYKPGMIEKAYREIIKNLIKEAKAQETYYSKTIDETLDYFSIWIHQIKTPITALKLILDQNENNLSRESLSELFKIEQYVEMVLNFLKVDNTNSDYVFETYDIDGLVKESIKRFSSEFILRKLKLNYSEIGTKIITDEKWFSFVLNQILSNALKYTPNGSISIYKEENYLCIEDTGIGIKEEDLPRIFEKGYTGFNGREYKRSSGLGLYLSKRILNNLGLGIKITSSVKKGTKVLIPLVQQEILVE